MNFWAKMGIMAAVGAVSTIGPDVADYFINREPKEVNETATDDTVETTENEET